jgi:Uri superfamily endonuclease
MEPTYRVYVIELDDAAGARVDPKKPCVYVGSTAHTPEVRLQRHLDGVHASRVVHKHGRRLRPDLSAGRGPWLARADAEADEVRLAEELAAEGYRVFGGH